MLGRPGRHGDDGDEGGGNGSQLSAFAGSYDGEIELWEAAVSGSNRIRIELDEDGHGSVRFGDLPIHSAPDHPYPDDASLPSGDSFDPRPLETVMYPVHEPSLEDGTLEFFVEMGDLLDAFCESQTSVTPPCDLPQYGYSVDSEAGECVVSIPDADDVRVETLVSCSRGKICYEMQACECEADTCEAKDQHQIYFRLTRDRGQVTGDVRFDAQPVYYEIDFD